LRPPLFSGPALPREKRYPFLRKTSWQVRKKKGRIALPSTSTGQLFAFQGDMLLVRLEPSITLPGPREIHSEEDASLLLHLFPQAEDRACSCIALGKDFALPDGMKLVSLREVWSLLGEDVFVRAGRAFQLMGWHRETRFCGQCGNPMSDHETETARTCKACGLTLYPPVSPAIIVAIEREGKLLLARSPHFPKGRYSVLAGFVEPGETLEQAVQREVFEEVSVRVRDIRYFGSQPWPFPHSLMVGFTAVWDSGEISVDAKEIEEASWFAPGEFPEMPPSISISRRLIDDFVLRHRLES
jgi:NTP pyrophosphohydrolases containing a Zn-finger, probably nucleic-acid-binding